MFERREKGTALTPVLARSLAGDEGERCLVQAKRPSENVKEEQYWLRLRLWLSKQGAVQRAVRPPRRSAKTSRHWPLARALIRLPAAVEAEASGAGRAAELAVVEAA